MNRVCVLCGGQLPTGRRGRPRKYVCYICQPVGTKRRYWGGPSNLPASALERHKRPIPGRVYFVGDNARTAVKVGFTKEATAENRLVALQRESPVQLEILAEVECRYSGYTERRVHLALAPARLHGEWFMHTDLIDAMLRAETEQDLWELCDQFGHHDSSGRVRVSAF